MGDYQTEAVEAALRAGSDVAYKRGFADGIRQAGVLVLELGAKLAPPASLPPLSCPDCGSTYHSPCGRKS